VAHERVQVGSSGFKRGVRVKVADVGAWALRRRCYKATADDVFDGRSSVSVIRNSQNTGVRHHKLSLFSVFLSCCSFLACVVRKRVLAIANILALKRRNSKRTCTRKHSL
jgi:hypothetical protein